MLLWGFIALVAVATPATLRKYRSESDAGEFAEKVERLRMESLGNAALTGMIAAVLFAVTRFAAGVSFLRLVAMTAAIISAYNAGLHLYARALTKATAGGGGDE